jgi:Holliday junction DNA helicase RuvB
MPDFLHPDKENYSREELMQEEQIRPQSFKDFAGQRKTLENLEVFVTAAKRRGGALIMFYCMVLRDWEKQL